MEPQNLTVKLYLADSVRLDHKALIPVFHRWIQEHRLDELMIDVADYTHVHQGPGVMLICHEAHYGLDEGGGRAGLLYSRKRGALGSLDDRFATALRKALSAARHLETEKDLAGKVAFRGDEIAIGIADRLLAPNTPATLAEVRPALERVLDRLHGGAPFTVSQVCGPKECFGVRVSCTGAADTGTLLGRLG